MSFFEDQEDDWFANDCQGSPDNYDGAGNFVPHDMGAPCIPHRQEKKRSRTQKRRDQRRRAEARTIAAAKGKADAA